MKPTQGHEENIMDKGTINLFSENIKASRSTEFDSSKDSSTYPPCK